MSKRRKIRLYRFRIQGAGHVEVLQGGGVVRDTTIEGEPDAVLRGHYKMFTAHFGNFTDPVAIILSPVSENGQGQALPLFVQEATQEVRDIDMSVRSLRTPGSPTYGQPKDETLIQSELALVRNTLVGQWRLRLPGGEKLMLAPSVTDGIWHTLLSNTDEIFLSWEAILFLIGEAKQRGVIDMTFDVREGDGWLPPPNWRSS